MVLLSAGCWLPPPPVLAAVVIALFKDIPDAAGDRGAGLRTLTVQHGPQKVFWTCIWLLTAAYAGAICYSLFAAASTATNCLSSAGVIGARTLACVSGHCLAVALLWRTALATDLSKKSDITAAYMHVWKLFYAEYILIPLLL
ncbi:hypothetical protein QJQ45_007722 [Haematococcus lacustris]|nr:hypothetical protein QJQ45_007722 [Haematococcus lacustris]